MTAQNLDFGGRVAIVTGAGQGMGRAHAKMLASRGARVVVNDLNADNAASAVAEIIADGGTAVVDINNVVTGAEAIVQTAIDAYGQLDVVVNNAGINAFGTFWEMDRDTWWRVFDVTVKGVVEVSRAAMPHLIASGTGRPSRAAPRAARMLLWLSSRWSQVGLSDSFGWCAGQGAVDLAGDESLEAAHDVLLVQSFLGAAFDVGAGAFVEGLDP
ncbi:hypothetical protein SHIRM173S_11196 [Streptomyces hirsutus]